MNDTSTHKGRLLEILKYQRTIRVENDYVQLHKK